MVAENLTPKSFWQSLEQLVGSCEIVIDRPKLSAHPNFPGMIYPLDYGYLEGTRTMDGGGIDLWIGSNPAKTLSGLAITVDLGKRDVEVKLLLGCNEDEIHLVMAFLNGYNMHAWYISRYE